MASKPSIPKGTRDFSPLEVSKRNYIISIMRHHFEKYGYQPIETPSFENSETLMGKYGDEGDRLIFKILDSGDYFEKKLENDILNSRSNISIYNFIDSLMSLCVNKILIDDLEGKAFSTLDDIEKLKGNKDLVNFISKEIKEIIEILAGDNPSINVQSNLDDLNDVNFPTYFLDECLIFIRENGLDFKERNNELNILKKANTSGKVFVKRISLEFIKIIKANIDIIQINSLTISKEISEKALRYDLTVPFARYVVQHQSEIEFPFKRYQIQPVWRADRPQKGRFREFYQCDADVVGSTSLWQEVELVQLYDAVFAALGLDGVTIKINNRKILSGIAEVIGASDKLIDFTVALDKLDKIGEDGVKKEMLEKGISEEALIKVQPLFSFEGTIQEKIEKLSTLLSTSEEGKKGIEELRFICENVTKLGLQKAILDLDVTLARGLNYYTGAIFEVAAPKTVAMGSIGGGGRYDDLTGIFDPKNRMSGVGISFGLDRIYLVLDELNLFPETVITSTKVMFLNFGESQSFEVMQTVYNLRKNNINVEMYPDAAKIDKQFKYAERRKIPFVVKEITDGKFTLKNLASGNQEMLTFEEMLEVLQ